MISPRIIRRPIRTDGLSSIDLCFKAEHDPILHMPWMFSVKPVPAMDFTGTEQIKHRLFAAEHACLGHEFVLSVGINNTAAAQFFCITIKLIHPFAAHSD